MSCPGLVAGAFFFKLSCVKVRRYGLQCKYALALLDALSGVLTGFNAVDQALQQITQSSPVRLQSGDGSIEFTAQLSVDIFFMVCI